jgi:MinD superfamily P-loop ATPase
LIKNVIEAFNKKTVDIPIIAVTGGKGGTGKTSIAVNLAVSLSKKGHRILLVDADVDSPTTAIVLGVQPKPIQEVQTFIPRIVEAKCNKCGKCSEACRAHALIQIKDKYPMFFEELCSGCEACLLACPLEAIEDGRKTVGHVYNATGDSVSFIGGELKPNETRSAQVITATKELAFKQATQESYDIMIVDTPPGTHCNVVQSLRGADLALAVTEPTPLGIYDLDLILKLASTLGILTQVVINKADLPGQDKEGVLEVAKHYGTEVISEVPVDRKLFQSYVAGSPLITAYPGSPAATALMKLAEAVLNHVKNLRGNSESQLPKN